MAPKAAAAAAEEAPAPQTPRKRGRPRKVPVEQAPEEAAATAGQDATKRRRGRPRKTAASSDKLQGGNNNSPAAPPSHQQSVDAGEASPFSVLPREEKRVLLGHLNRFESSAGVQDRALELYVNSQLFQTAINEFRTWMLRALTDDLRAVLLELPSGSAAQELLFGYFAQFVLTKFKKEVRAYRDLVKTVDLRQPHLWYPIARSMKRRIIYHAGPTNSGKTYHALQAMTAAPSGVYCGPLRLLAMEIYDSCNANGTYCNLITGQERKEVEGASHTSCTIEMTSTQKRVDVAVIDEIQMIGDEQRGWAWTRALQGLAANEIHLCGDASALPLVRQMADAMGEELTVQSYDRFTPLAIEERYLRRGYASVQPGDCVVAFSRRDIFDIKQIIEQSTGYRVCVVYGALPPEMRRNQARLFNAPDNSYDVLVASDAIGMGLNLNIRRVIFHTLHKFEGNFKQPVSVSQIKQIAGRAGRRNSQYNKGVVTCLNKADMPRLREALDTPLEDLSTPAAGLFPEFEHLEMFAGQLPEESFARLLTRFGEEARLDGTYFFCKQDSVIHLAKLLSRVPSLTLEERYHLCNAPCNTRDPRSASAFLHFASQYALGVPVTLDIAEPKKAPASPEELRHMEAVHQIVSLYIWLSFRFKRDMYPGQQSAMRLSERIINLMAEGLHNIGAPGSLVFEQGKRAVAVANVRHNRILTSANEVSSDYWERYWTDGRGRRKSYALDRQSTQSGMQLAA
ncbi:hypothetical protein WJX72_003314 [[Myrmecia] bisecta]|uniref:RNA helicase n=1 Tax=[Myrmecia] bisecta TaxID=41462 RepID=A0AAW1Q6C3_9CHLO